MHPEPVTSFVTFAAEAQLPTRYGNFRIRGYEERTGIGVQEYVALVMGDLRPEEGVPAPLVRVHSKCLTGDTFHSLRCDCGQQLELAMAKVAAEGRGAVIYDGQEGRGIGLINKLRAYALQDAGADTVEANEQLGFEADLRSYGPAGEILRDLGATHVRLLSNNPAKVRALEAAGIIVDERVSAQVEELSAFTERYLRTKKEKLGHLLEAQ